MSASAAASTNFHDTETLTTEKAHLDSLVVEQQLSLCKVVDLYGEYQASETEHASDEQAVVPARERVASIITEMKPDSLELYQERSLEQVYTSSAESERVVAVLKIASPYADRLMKQWTILDRPEAHYELHDNSSAQNRNGKSKPPLRRIASQPNQPASVTSRNAYLNSRQPDYRNPSVESDSEDDVLSSKFSTRSTVGAAWSFLSNKAYILSEISFTISIMIQTLSSEIRRASTQRPKSFHLQQRNI